MFVAFLVACGLLLLGFILRATLRPLQWLHIPASVVGGLVGLTLAQAAAYWRSGLASDSQETSSLADALGWVQTDLVQVFHDWPGWLIAILFSGLLLEKRALPKTGVLNRIQREGIAVWIIGLGQAAVGLTVTWLFLQPFFDLPNSFGMMIETGFAGGHGTAAMMGVILEDRDTVVLENARDLGMFMATAGLAFSIASGIFYINLAIRFGWTRRGDVQTPQLTGLEARHSPEPIAYGRVRGEVLDPLVFQVLILAVAVALGYALQHTLAEGVRWLEGDGEGMKLSGFVSKLPLFIFTMMGGLVVRLTMHWLKISDLVDSDSIRRLTAASIEFLVVAALVSLDLKAVWEAAIPLTAMLIAAFLWTGICLLVVARKLLPPEHWFELGIINYGMSTGTTATGFVLLRIVDKEMDSGAAEEFALAAPLHVPFVCGGLVTLMLPLLVLENLPMAVIVPVLWAVIAGLYYYGRRLAKTG